VEGGGKGLKMNSLKGTLTIGILVLMGLFSANAFAQFNCDCYYVRSYSYADIDTYVDVGTDLDVGDDLEVQGYFVGYDGAEIFGDVMLADNSTVAGDLQVYGNTIVDDIFGDLAWFNKIVSNGGYDPPYVLYDKQTREQIVDMVTRELLPGKEDGAALFFNKDTKRLETYVASEGKFYDLNGNVVYTLAKIELPTTKYQTIYFLHSSTGKVCRRLSPVCNKYVVRKGFALNNKTGEFVNRTIGCVVPREEALAIYVPKDQKYYDLKGNLIRSEPNEKEIEYRTEYYFDKLTGDVTPIRKAVRDIFVIRKGFTFNKQTGEFVDDATGEIVPKEMAIEVKEDS